MLYFSSVFIPVNIMVLRLIVILSSVGGASFSLSHLMMLVAGECVIGNSFIAVWFLLLVCLDLLLFLLS